MNRTFLALSMIASTIVIGCQPANPKDVKRMRDQINGTTTDAKQTPTVEGIIGNWETTCLADTTHGQMYRLDTLEISSTILTATSSYYSDSDCTISLYILNSNAKNFTLLTDALYGKTTLSTVISSLTILPQTKIMADLFKQNSYCKVSDWNNGQMHIINDASACGISVSSKSTIELYGSDELRLNSQKFLRK